MTRHLLTPIVLLLAAANTHAADWSSLDAAIERGIAEGKAPGAVVLIGRGDEIVYERAYGDRAVDPTREAMTVDTIFDLASLTKPIACATSVMLLVDRGQIELSAPVARYLPEFGNNGKEIITVEMLLRHHGGLIADNPMKDYVGTREEMIARIMQLTPTSPPGTKFVYTDVGFIVLGELVHRLTGKPLDVFARDEVFGPLGMNDTSYQPPASWRPRIAPTEKRKGEMIRGEIHDPRAFALGGVAGHAGAFGTARDVARWTRMLNAGGTVDGKQFLSEATVRQMLTPSAIADGTGSRGLGVDIDSSFALSPRGNRFDRGTTFGHTGWTGTSVWSDPKSDTYVILLTSRCHPNGKGNVIALRREVATIAATQLLGPAPATRDAAGRE